MCNCTYLPPPSKVPAVNHQVDIRTIGLPFNDHSIKSVFPVTDQDEISMVDSIVVYIHINVDWSWRPSRDITKLLFSAQNRKEVRCSLNIQECLLYWRPSRDFDIYSLTVPTLVGIQFRRYNSTLPIQIQRGSLQTDMSRVLLKERKCTCLDKSMQDQPVAIDRLEIVYILQKNTSYPLSSQPK